VNDRGNYILWLPSWYPDRFHPFSGDFIQRHARAAALYEPISVIHFAAPGEDITIENSVVDVKESGNLKELIVYTKFQPTGIALVDKLRYNIFFYSNAKRFLIDYFEQHGFPKLVHVHIPVKAGNLARWIRKYYGISYVISEHGSYYMYEAEDSYFKRHLLYKTQVRKVFQNAIQVTNVSAAIGHILQRLFQLKNLVIIHNTVDTRFFNYNSTKHTVFTFIHVSTLTEQKNVIGILKTFEQLLSIRTDWKLLLVGPPNNAILEFVRQRKLQANIDIVGEVPYETVAHHVKKAHVLVMFSRHENFPCAIIEALCCGVPVVASNVAGIPEAVDSSNGLLVPSENESALLQALLQIRNNYETYDQMEISRKAISNYSYETIGRQIFNLYYAASHHAG
jgi:glycosyltransferase involved in cell wall biosynthesis